MGAPAMTEEKIYTVKEVAAILRIAPTTVRKMIAQGEINAFRLRDEWRIRKSALDAAMKERERRKSE